MKLCYWEKLSHATGVDTSEVATKKDGKKTKLEDLNVVKLKTAPVDLKKLGDVLDNEVLNNAKFNTLKTKVTV